MVANQNASFSVSRESLVYLAGNRATTLAWIDRSGKVIHADSDGGDYGWPSLSRDDRRIAIDRVEPDTGARVIWILDDRGVTSRMTSASRNDSDAVWSSDGRHIAFAHDVGRALLEITIDSAASQRTLLQFGKSDQVYPTDCSADNRFIAYAGYGASTGADIWLLPLAGDSKPVAFAVTKASEHQARFSPDGRWVAYASDESGQPEVWVQAVPPRQFRRQISSGGGAQPMWRKDGRELFSLAPDNMLMAVPIQLGATVVPGTAAPLFKVAIEESTFYSVRNHYAAASDGQRFLVNSVIGGAQALQVVLNWSGLLRK